MESKAAAESEQVAAELSELRHMRALSADIKQNAKAKELLTGLKQGFARLKELGAKQKALIFTENRTTQDFLFSLLDNGPYKGKVLTYHGGKTREYSIMERFRNEAKSLISTDIGAEGFNLEFCSFVVNYDLPYNTLTIEQRINRCHRQGQQSDVIILNFLNRNNFADVRMLELINKRILQFSGIFGMSDDVIGNFGIDLGNGFSKVLGKTRTKEEIDRTYRDALELFEEENKRLVDRAEHSLFTSFTKDVAEKVHITPQYIASKTREIEDDLWYVTRWFFEGKQGFRLDEATRTVAVTHLPPPKVFTGKALRRTEYSMAKDYQPRSGRHTVTGSLARGILGELFWRGIPESGSIVVDADMEPCELALYEVRVRPKGNFWGGYAFYPLTGETGSGRVLSHDECAALMALPVLTVSTRGEPVGNRNRHLRPAMEHKLDRLISGEEFIRKVLTETDSAEKEAVNALKNKATERKVALERGLDALRFQVKTAKAALEKELSRMERLSLQRRCSKVSRELKQAEQNLFMRHSGTTVCCAGKRHCIIFRKPGTHMEKLDGRSKDIEQTEREKLASVFPQCFVEGKLDIDKLLSLCGEYILHDFGKYEFTWKGKSECLPLAQQRSTATLRPCPEESVNFETTQNLYIEGDNLEVLKLLQTSYFRRVKMIYIDPPYNTGNDFVYEDDFKDPLERYREVTSQTTKSNPEAMGRFHTNWLNMMYPRLRLAANLLRDDGVIFISIDDHEVHNLRKLCDEVFGEENFITTILWQKVYAPKNSAKHFSGDHDFILVYARNADIWRPRLLPRTEEMQARYGNLDNDPRGPWKPENLSARNYYGAGTYPITCPSGRIISGPPTGNYWRISKEKFKQLDADNRIWWGEDGNNSPAVKRFLSEVQDGVVPQTMWFYKDVGHTQEAKKELLAILSFSSSDDVFETPKSKRLIQKMLRVATNPHDEDIILDFFSGSGTTGHAVMELNKEDGGNRHFILVQLPELTGSKEYPTIAEIGKERIRRAGTKILENVEPTKQNEKQIAKHDSQFSLVPDSDDASNNS